jgi:NitT/TauT family transport system substrate-binding protein
LEQQAATAEILRPEPATGIGDAPSRPVLAGISAKNSFMKRTHVIVLFAAGAFAAATPQASAQTAVRFGYCTAALSSAFTPFTIAAKIWWAAAGIKVELVPTPGSTNCVKAVASRDVSYSLPSIEPLAIMRHQGVKAKNFYTAYQGLSR